MALQTKGALDSTDWKILRELQQHARISFNELGRRVGLSSPSVTERVRKLEDAGIIQGYHANIDESKLGLPVVAFIQLRCASDSCLFKSGCAEAFPEVIEMYKTAGTNCALLKVAVGSFAHLEALNERLGQYGQQLTTIVTSCVFDHRSIDQLQTEVDVSVSTTTRW